ncbi:acyl-CoA dehydrogenase [Pontibacillus yanchengensis]|nr:acyl-CoA dehydrogenase [Pontibacillus yanchengensis]
MRFFSDDIRDRVREDALAMEKRGDLAPDILEYIYDQGLFKLLVPEQFGGIMTTLPRATEIYEEASYMEGNFGWLIGICSGGGFITKLFPEHVYREKFTNREAVISGSGYPSGTARAVNGGYVVNGEWKFCSGSSFATLFTVNAMIEHGDGKDAEMRTFVFERDQVELVGDWNATGMKATNSQTIQVREAFVPEDRALLFDMSATLYEEPFYTYPFMQFAKVQFAAVALGISRHFLEECKALAETHKQEWDKGEKYSFILEKVHQAEENLEKARNQFYEVVHFSWNAHVNGEYFSEEQLSEISIVCEDAAAESLRAAQSVFPYLGITAVLEDNLVNKTWRDLQTACQHGLILSFR